MGKNDIRDIARILSDKHKLSIKDAEGFLTAFFDTLHEGLDNDKQVKVKGFGTFKVIDVKERESVDVNTGERIKIEGRSKITFIADSVMKDLVNKPFSQFETVVLNEGIDFSDNDNNMEEKSIETIEEEKTVEEMDMEEAKQRYYKRKKKRMTIMSVVVILAMIISFCLGYFLGRKSYVIFPLTIAEEVVEDSVVDFTPDVHVVNTDRIETVKKDSIAAAKAKAESMVKTEKVEHQSEKVEEKKVDEKEQKVDAATVLATARKIMNSGAYDIVGTETTVTVKKGQTLSSISKFYFGDGMECYIQVHNGIAEAKEGDKVKIPKLRIKKQGK